VDEGGSVESDIQLFRGFSRSWNAVGGRWKFEKHVLAVVPVSKPC